MRREPSFLKDILSACRKIETIVAATNEASFVKDEVLPAAVLHHLTVDRRGDQLIWIGRSSGTQRSAIFQKFRSQVLKILTTEFPASEAD